MTYLRLHLDNGEFYDTDELVEDYSFQTLVDHCHTLLAMNSIDVNTRVVGVRYVRSIEICDCADG
jgi:hypothetical protein